MYEHYLKTKQKYKDYEETKPKITQRKKSPKTNYMKKIQIARGNRIQTPIKEKKKDLKD